LVILAIVIATVVGGYFYFHQRQADKLAFNTVVSTRGEVTQNVTATGILNPVKSVQVGCQVSGRINKLYVDFNSPVTNGQIIAEIDQRVYLAQVAQAEADLSNSMANLELQRVQATRNAELFTNQLVSGSDFDISVATLHQAEAAVKIKQALLDNARANLAYTKIISPVDGVIISRSVDVGQTVAASFNTPTLFLIANDLTKMQIDAAVAEADVGGILEDQTVEFTVDAYPYRTFNGAVTQVRNSPTTLNNVVTYDAVVGVTNADYKLKPGMTANVSIIVAQRNDVVKVPNAALRFRPPEAAVILTNQLVSLPPATNAVVAGKGKGRGNRNVRTVYKLAGENSGELIPVQVKTGITDGIFTEIVAGLNEGDKVVSGVVSTDAPAAASNPFGGGNMPRR
jgi:HlyD family secretion protein